MSNILKQYYVTDEQKKVRIINNNSALRKLILESVKSDVGTRMDVGAAETEAENKTADPMTDVGQTNEEFSEGLNADVVIEQKADIEKEKLLENARLEADKIINDAKAEADRLMAEAKQRAQILYADNKSKGYADGLEEQQNEFEQKKLILKENLLRKRHPWRMNIQNIQTSLSQTLLRQSSEYLTRCSISSLERARRYCFIW